MESGENTHAFNRQGDGRMVIQQWCKNLPSPKLYSWRSVGDPPTKCGLSLLILFLWRFSPVLQFSHLIKTKWQLNFIFSLINNINGALAIVLKAKSLWEFNKVIITILPWDTIYQHYHQHLSLSPRIQSRIYKRKVWIFSFPLRHFLFLLINNYT